MLNTRKNNLPKISIVIPSLNKVEFIKETLDSIVLQKYPELEVIIMDGGSSDGTLEIIEKYVKKYPKIFSLGSKKDKGQVDAINKGLKKARGEILSFINADDVYEKGALNKVGEVFRDNPNTVWAAGRGKVIDEKGKEIARFVTWYKNLLLRINRYPLLLVVNYLIQPSVFLSKSAFTRRKGFGGMKKFVTEYDMWIKLSQEVMPKIISRNLSRFRIAKGTITQEMSKELLEADEKVLGKYTNNSLVIIMHKLHNKMRFIIEKRI